MRRLITALILALMGSTAAPADVAGDFDYYVLSLSWSPNWCDRTGSESGSDQCDPDRDLGWVLHGLWPQYESGWPSYCASPWDDPSRRQTAEMADIMGTSGSAWHQWNKHGVCSGLSSEDYYALSRQAYAAVEVPPVLNVLSRRVLVPALNVEAVFLKANPDLSPDGVTVTCQAGQIQEIRLCLTKDLDPRDCAPDVRRDCTLDRALLIPID